MDFFYISTAVFTGLMGLWFLYQFFTDSLTYPAFFTMTAFVFWTLWALSKVAV